MIGDLSQSEQDSLLRSQRVGRIGCHYNGITYVVPVSYVFQEGYVYSRSKEGMKIQMMRRNPLVCFEVDEVKDLHNWKSVIAWGNFEELKGPESTKAFNLLSRTLGDLQPEPMEQTGQNTNGPYRDILFRIKLFDITGRFERRHRRRSKSQGS
ncbi:MAG: pyridoxamine 5'-phosphate oxidase family protein [Chitinophagales bacterium]|nr:pyridoxamine 5'-phosphate oxidase family protein [Chitinophagales bacterium]